MQHLSNQLRGTLLVALSGTLFGFLGYLGTQLIDMNLSIENMLFWRFLMASICLLPGILLFKSQQSLKNMPKSVLIKTLIVSAICYTGNSAFYFIAAEHIGTGLAMVIFFSFPVFVTILMWLFDGWRANKYAVAALVAVGFGMILLKGHGVDAVNLHGVFFAVLAAVCYAFYIYDNQHHSKSIDARLLTLLVCMGNTVIFLIWSLTTQTFTIPNTLEMWFFIFLIGIIATTLPIQLLLNGLKYISPVKASIISVLEPVVTLVLGCLLLAETVAPLQLLGVVIILLGAIFIQFESQPDTKTSSSKAEN
ncbi:MAG: DMT family transporter [Gammaproteobacteria bacterium]